jgi:outer membrane lipopolysaccharide assembly protein LptE/RlpB
VLRRLAALATIAAFLVAAGCGDDTDGDTDSATALAQRISAILESDSSAVVERLAEGGSEVDADALADADVVCPRVEAPEPGDRATCRVTAAGTELELDVEFQDDGGIEVVTLAVAP